MNTEIILSLEALQFKYKPPQADVLNNLTLDIPAGMVTAILGPNGAGKTTLLHILLGYLTPQSGTVRIHGKPQSQYTRQEMSRLIGLVPQSEYLPFDFSVLEYVLLGRAPYLAPLEMPGKEDYAIAMDALTLLGLQHLRDRPITELSGGERQMILLARSLAQQTRILLLDEPTSHLDLSNKGRLLDILQNLTVRGVTIILTTHDPETVVSIAHYLILMRSGEILDSGPMKSVLTAEKLSQTYQAPIKVVQVDGHPVVLLDRRD